MHSYKDNSHTFLSSHLQRAYIYVKYIFISMQIFTCAYINTYTYIYIYIYKHTHIYVYSHIFFSSPWALFRLSHLRGKYILSTCRWKSDSEAEIKLAASSPLVRHWTGGFATKLFFLSETSGLLDAIGQIHQRASNTSQSIAAKIVALVSQNCPSN
jgi:hypothetical protein